MSTIIKNTHPTDATLTRKVIIDVDVGTDDAWAIIMLIHFEESYNIKIVGITCVSGNTNVCNVGKNVLKILDTVNRLDIPIYLGAKEALIPGPPDELQFHKTDGLGDIQETIITPDLNIIKTEHAITAMKRIICENPHEVSLICVAPLTNIGLCLKVYPEIKDKLKDIFIMGGNCEGVGNRTRCAEFNFFTDPESVHIVLKSLKCPITILPWEACVENRFFIPLEWRFNKLGSVENKITSLLNAAERNCYDNTTYNNWAPCDAMLAAVFIRPDIVGKFKTCNSTIELGGKYTRGQLVIDHLEKETPNVSICEYININLFKEMIMASAGHTDPFEI